MMTGIFTLLGVILSAIIGWINNYFSNKRKDKERTYEEKKIIYLNYIDVMTEYNGIFVSNALGENPIKSKEEAFLKAVKISQAAAKVKLFGSKEIINLMMTVENNEDARSHLPHLIKVMQKDLGINQ